MKRDRLAITSIVKCILKPHHSLLRKEVERAANLVGSVVVEQRPPLCRTLLPLFRLFQEFRRELEDHLDAQDDRLFPELLEMEAALRAGEHLKPAADDLSEELRLLKYGHSMLTSVLQEMRDLTHGFASPADACECYAELLDVLAAIQMETDSEVRMEGSLLFPEAIALLEEARHRHAADSARRVQVA